MSGNPATREVRRKIVVYMVSFGDLIVDFLLSGSELVIDTTMRSRPPSFAR